MMFKEASLVCIMVSALMIYPPDIVRALTSTDYEQKIVQKINVIRAGHGLQRVRYSSCADEVAERWARRLREQRILVHRSMTFVMNKCSAEGAGEILGSGSIRPWRMVQLWMGSPTHRSVILDSKWNRVGVGAVRDSTGRWWVAINFLYQN